MKLFFTWMLVMGWGAATLGVTQEARAEEVPPPDPAAHTVIVPFDSSKPRKDQKPASYYLDYETFQQLWNQAKENRRPEAPVVDEASGVTVNLALHEVEVKENALLLTSRFRLASRGGWQSIKLPLSLAGSDAADWLLDGRTAPIKEGAIILSQPGSHEVEAKISAGLDQGWQSAALNFPPGIPGLLRLTVPLSDGLPEFGDSSQPSFVSEEVREGKRVFTFALSQGGAVAMKRQTARRAGDQTPPAVCEISSELTVRPRVETLRSTFFFRFPGAERTSLSVLLDESVRPISWSATTLTFDSDQKPTGWATASYKDVVVRRENGRLIADIRLNRPVRDHFQIILTAVRVFDQVEGSRAAPFVSAAASRVEHTLEIGVSPALKVTATGSAERVPPFPRASAPPLGAWRVRKDDTLSYTVSVADESASARIESLVQAGVNKLEIMVAATLTAGRLPIKEAYANLPPGYEVQSVQGSGIRGWQRDAGGVFIQFDSTVSKEARFVLNAALARPPGEVAAVLPVVYFDGMAKQKATVFLAVNAAMEVRTQFDRAWRETDPAQLTSVFTVAPPWVVKRAMVWEPDTAASKQPPSAPAVTLISQPPKFSADAVLLVQSTDEALRFSQQVGINVEQGAVGGLRVRLPVALPEAHVSGPDVRDVQVKVEGAFREYTVTFQGDILGNASVTLDWELAASAEVVMPQVTVEGSSRLRRFFILDNTSARELKTELKDVEKSTVSAVPWLPEGLQRTEVYQTRGADPVMKLTFSNTESTAGNAAIITLAEITTAFRRDGERWETVVYSLANRSLQFLPVRLPRGAELITVMVGNELVRADRGRSITKDGKEGEPYHLVPLLQMRAGELSQRVQLTYRVTAENGPLHDEVKLDDPELVGLSAERTLWNVWVPEGMTLDDFDGNMEEVVEEVIEDEKAQQKLSDIQRLNRVASSSKVSEYDAKEAYDNAAKALEEVKQYQQSKKSRLFSLSSESGKGKKAAAKQGNDEQVRKSEQQVEQQLLEQQQVFTGNSGKIAQQQQELKKTGTGSFQFRQQDGPGAQPAFKGNMNIWNANGNPAAANPQAGQGGQVVLSGNNTVLNDNVAVGNNFLIQDNESKDMKLPHSPQAKADGQKFDSNILLNNARGANFAQKDGESTVSVNAAKDRLKDWDNGSGPSGDGAYLNKLAAPPPPQKPGEPATSVTAGTLTLNGGSTFAGTLVVPARPASGPVAAPSGPSAGVGGAQLGTGGLGRPGMARNHVAASAAPANLSMPTDPLASPQLPDPFGQRTMTLPAAAAPAPAAPFAPAPAQPGMAPAGADPFGLSQKADAPVVAGGGQRFDMDVRGGDNRRGEDDVLGGGVMSGERAQQLSRPPLPVDVNGKLESGYSYYNLGDYDKAMWAFQEVLRQDPYNGSARRGMEQTESKRSDYFAAAKDHLRSKMLNSVSEGWEESVSASSGYVTPQLKPQGRVSLPVEVPLSGSVYHFRKLKDHASLELDIDEPMEPRRKAALYWLLAGSVVLAGMALWGRRRKRGGEVRNAGDRVEPGSGAGKPVESF